MKPLSIALSIALFTAVTFCLPAFAQLPQDLKSDIGPDVPKAIRVRPGYRVTLALAPKAIREARFLQFSEDGKTLFVAARHEGVIYALRDPDAEGVYKTVTTFVKNKASLQGMDVHD